MRECARTNIVALGEYESATRIVPMTAENMPPGSSALVRTMMPLSARELGF